ncbi:hypothetical protein M011DRAFT_459199 [Sporormia fimetaria CBS 119925]|uniref:G domain-containing protein n=1 Tax=Sporormia fimetaria CBS 119925 TaxID=1340428 RepID=A0A6A6V8J1_9PLEO|nr:hypothetical protein M011DRAFT_459199 [Sporormia fimetaria CBS 119925]
MGLFRGWGTRTSSSNQPPPPYEEGPHGRSDFEGKATHPYGYRNNEQPHRGAGPTSRSTKTERESIKKTASDMQITQNDVVIAVMGVTGTGKSTFIELVTGLGLKIGHELQSCTAEVGIHAFQDERGRKIYLVDTPGFDDTRLTDSDVLKQIAYFLGASFSKQVKLAGIIYLHPITDERMKGSAVKNLAMFHALCGTASLEHVVLATTKWDKLLKSDSEATGRKREKELAETPNFWGDMLDNGSRMFRHVNTRESALRIINHLLSVRGDVVLDIQRQMIVEGRSLDQTSAGQKLQSELVEQRKRYEAELRDVRESLNTAIQAGNQKMMKTMARLEEETAEKLRKSEQEREKIRTDYARLQSEGEARHQQRLKELHEALNQYRALADKKQAILNRLEKQTSELSDAVGQVRDKRVSDAKQWQSDAASRKAQHDLEMKKWALFEEDRKVRNAALAAQARTTNIIAALQGVAGLGLMGLGAWTGMNPYFLGSGASMMGQAAHNAASGISPTEPM